MRIVPHVLPVKPSLMKLEYVSPPQQGPPIVEVVVVEPTTVELVVVDSVPTTGHDAGAASSPTRAASSS